MYFDHGGVALACSAIASISKLPCTAENNCNECSQVDDCVKKISPILLLYDLGRNNVISNHKD